MAYLSEWVLLTAVMLAGVASPGPDFVLAVKTSLTDTRRAGVWTAIGFAAGVAVHVAIGITGIGAIITQSKTGYMVMTYAGAAYLIWIGIKALRSQGAAITLGTDDGKGKSRDSVAGTLSSTAAFRQGFFTNILNPKAMIFFIALFTQIIRPDLPGSVMISFAATCILITAGWFSFVAVVLTHGVIRRQFLKASRLIDRISGVLLIGLAIRVLFSRAPAAA